MTFSLTKGILPTPTIQQIRRRRDFGRFTRSPIPVIGEAQREIIKAIRSSHVMTKNQLAVRAGVDRHLLMRMLENKVDTTPRKKHGNIPL